MSDFWIRQSEVIAGGKSFKSDDLDIDFDVPFDNNDEPDVAKIILYNPSENSINAILKGQNLILNAGYKGDVGTIFMGTIQEHKTFWQGVDKVTEFTAGDGSEQWLKKYISTSYGANVTAAAILSDLTGKFGLELGQLKLVNNITYPKGRVIAGMLKDALKDITAECGSQLTITKGKIVIKPFNEGKAIGFLLTSDTGLLGSPEPFSREENDKIINGFKVQMLLNHRITVNSIIQIQSKTANGSFRVQSGKHTGEFITEVEVLQP